MDIVDLMISDQVITIGDLQTVFCKYICCNYFISMAVSS